MISGIEGGIGSAIGGNSTKNYESIGHWDYDSNGNRYWKITSVTGKKNAKNPKKKKEKKPIDVPTNSPSLIKPSAVFNPMWFPPEEFHRGRVSIRLTAYKFLNLSANSRNRMGKKIERDPQHYTYILYFIAPNEIQEPISHTWEAYDSLASRLADKAGFVNKIEQELKGIKNSALKTELVKGLKTAMGSGMKETADAAYKAIAKAAKNPAASIDSFTRLGMNANVSTNRVDSPLVYKNSSRRLYDFIFQLFTDKSDYAISDIVYPVRLLQYLSTPGIPDSPYTKNAKSIAEVTPPYVFSIQSVYDGGIDTDFINIDTMVLKNVQATYRGPYPNGYPISAELHLTFEELDPNWDINYFPESCKKVTTYDYDPSHDIY